MHYNTASTLSFFFGFDFFNVPVFSLLVKDFERTSDFAFALTENLRSFRKFDLADEVDFMELVSEL